MVTKTKLGLLSAALMMILGTQGVDAQLLRSDVMAKPNASRTAVLDTKGLPNTSASITEGKATARNLSAPMNRAPRRAVEDSRLTASAVHPKAWYTAKTYTWTDADGVSHTSSLTDEATDPYQIYSFISEIFSNGDIPGIQFSGMGLEDMHYRWPYRKHYGTDGTYNYTLGWGKVGESLFVNDPVENGYTVCLVKVKDELPSASAYFNNQQQTTDYLGQCIDGVDLLTDGLRVDEGGDQAGTVFSYTGELNRFFFISKGKNYTTYTTPGYSIMDSVYFTNTSSSYFSLSSPWSGRIDRYRQSSGGKYTYYYYIASSRSVTYTVRSGVSNEQLRLQYVAASDGYIKVTTKNGSQIYTIDGGYYNTCPLSGTFSTGDVITIQGCTSSGGNSNSPYMFYYTTANGMEIERVDKNVNNLYPSIMTYDDEDEEDFLLSYAPFYDMFEEFSPTSQASGSEITDFYPTLMQGEKYHVQHDCSSVIALRHFFSMSGNDGTEKKSLSNLLFYIPDNRARVEDGRDYNSVDINLRPQVALYVVELEASIAPDDEEKEHTFDVTVDWESSLDNLTNCDVPETYELHAYWTDPVTGEEKDSVIYTGPNTSYTYEVPQYMASYTIDYKVKATPTNASNPDEFYAWSNVDDVIVPGYDDFFMLDRDHYESDFVITSETNFYRNFLFPKNKDIGGYTPYAIKEGMNHFVLYRQSTDDGDEPVPVADLYFQTQNGKVYYKIEYREGTQHPINNTNN